MSDLGVWTSPHAHVFTFSIGCLSVGSTLSRRQALEPGIQIHLVLLFLQLLSLLLIYSGPSGSVGLAASTCQSPPCAASGAQLVAPYSNTNPSGTSHVHSWGASGALHGMSLSCKNSFLGETSLLAHDLKLLSGPVWASLGYI